MRSIVIGNYYTMCLSYRTSLFWIMASWFELEAAFARLQSQLRSQASHSHLEEFAFVGYLQDSWTLWARLRNRRCNDQEGMQGTWVSLRDVVSDVPRPCVWVIDSVGCRAMCHQVLVVCLVVCLVVHRGHTHPGYKQLTKSSTWNLAYLHFSNITLHRFHLAEVGAVVIEQMHHSIELFEYSSHRIPQVLELHHEKGHL